MQSPQTALPGTVDLITQGIDQNLHLGAQVYVSLAGTPVADCGIGEARYGLPMTSETIMLWFSSVKPVAAVAIGQLWEQGKLDLDDRVSAYIPEFGAGGKEAVTLRHLLTHTAGFRFVEARWRPVPWEVVIAGICAAPLEPDWRPGRRAGYHVASAWFILGELVRRIDGRPYARYVREEIFLPLGMQDSWVGMPPEQFRAYGNRIGFMHNTAGNPESKLDPFWDAEEDCVACRPGGGGRGPIRELGYFYEMLLARGQRAGTRLLSPQTVEALTARHRVGMVDETLGYTIDWGLGFIRDSKQYGSAVVPYGYGEHSSPRTFGHGGYQSSIAFADPEYDLVVAIVVNGTPGNEQHYARFHALTSAVYLDLGLVG